MTIKTISWFVGGYIQATPHEGADRFGAGRTFIADGDYFPRAMRIYLDSAPYDRPVVVDVQDDGVSIFTAKPQVDKGTVFKEHDSFRDTGESKIEELSVLTLDIPHSGQDARNLTVELDLEEI